MGAPEEEKRVKVDITIPEEETERLAKKFDTRLQVDDVYFVVTNRWYTHTRRFVDDRTCRPNLSLEL